MAVFGRGSYFKLIVYLLDGKLRVQFQVLSG